MKALRPVPHEPILMPLFKLVFKLFVRLRRPLSATPVLDEPVEEEEEEEEGEEEAEEGKDDVEAPLFNVMAAPFTRRVHNGASGQLTMLCSKLRISDPVPG